MQAVRKRRTKRGARFSSGGGIADPRAGVTPAACPACDVVLNAATDVDGDLRPKPEDRTFCIHCGAGLVFEVDGALRAMTVAEFEETIRELTPPEREVLQALAVNRRHERN